MSIRSPRMRRLARDLTWMATAVCAVMLVISTFAVLDARHSPVSAATVAGTATLSTTGGETSGGSSAAFNVVLPAGAACSGDSASGGYKVQSYMVPEAVDPGTLVYGNTGPTPGAFGASFRKPLYSSAGQAFVNKLTDVQTGVVTGLPSFNFALFKPNGAELAPPGTYNLGIACTLGTGSSQVLDKYWNAKITINADAGDPNGIAWSIPTGGGTTTTTSGGTTTTLGEGTTTTTDGSGTTTTTDGSGTTTTTDGTTTTTGGADVSGSDIFSGGNPSAASPVTTMGQLPYTGSSPLPMVFWAVALLVFGRVAMLLGKRPKVVDGPGA